MPIWLQVLLSAHPVNDLTLKPVYHWHISAKTFFKVFSVYRTASNLNISPVLIAFVNSHVNALYDHRENGVLRSLNYCRNEKNETCWVRIVEAILFGLCLDFLVYVWFSSQGATPKILGHFRESCSINREKRSYFRQAQHCYCYYCRLELFMQRLY